LDPIDKHALMVALAKVDGKVELCTFGVTLALDVVEAHSTVDARLTGTKHIKVRTV
jgi:hypothetical protein